MTLHIDPILKAEIQRQAVLNGNSASSVGGAMLEAKAREELHKQQAATLETTLERLMAKFYRRMAKRLAFFLTTILFDVGHIKVHTTNLLGMQKGMNEEMLKDILRDADRQTKSKLSRKNPELTGFVDAIEKWLVAEEEDPKASGGETNGHSGRGGAGA
jgi:predicted kinase